MAGHKTGEGLACFGLLRLSDDQYTVLWISLWMFMNIFQTLMNKRVFTHTQFNYPCILTAMNMLATYAMCAVWVRAGWVEKKVVTERSDKTRLFFFSFLLAFHVMLNLAGLQFVSVSMSQIMRSTIPIFTMLLSSLLLRKVYPIPQMVAVLPIVIGVMMCVKGDLEFHLIGLCVVVAGCLVAAMKGIVASILLTGALKMHPIQLLYCVAPYTVVELLVVAGMVGEVGKLYEERHTLFDFNVISMISTTSFLAFFVNLSNFSVNKRTSPLTLAVCGNFKRVLTIVISIFLFQKKISVMNIFGLIIGCSGTFVYSFFEYRYRKKRLEIIELEDAKDLDLPEQRPRIGNKRQSSGGVTRVDTQSHAVKGGLLSPTSRPVPSAFMQV